LVGAIRKAGGRYNISLFFKHPQSLWGGDLKKEKY